MRMYVLNVALENLNFSLTWECCVFGRRTLYLKLSVPL